MQSNFRLPLPRAALCFALSLLAGAAGPAWAASAQSNLVSVAPLGSDSSKGVSVRSDLLLANDGNFYAVASAGGASGYGAVVQVTPGGTTTAVHSLTGPSDEGSAPYAPVIQANDGNLYGTTYFGGSRNLGTVYRVSTAGTFATLYSFDNASQGGFLPYTGLAQDPASGDLFGTTLRGGANDAGTVFRLTLAGTLTTVATFDGTNGKNPEGRLAVGPDGALYGTTLIGGSDDRGTVYRITPGGQLTTIYSFPALGAFNTNGVAGNAVGANPRAGLTLGTDGNFYGTAYQGGAAGYGTIFRITPAGAITVLHSFGGPPRDGSFPLSTVSQMPDGSLVGTTEQGGALGAGITWRIDPQGNYTVLHSFSGTAFDGAKPYATLTPYNGGVYGVSYTDSTLAGGVVFRLELPTSGALSTSISASPDSMTLGASTTVTWNGGAAVACSTSGGANGLGWADTIGVAGSLTLTPTAAGIYNYIITCTDGAGVARNASVQVVVTTPALQPVDGGNDGSGGGAFPLAGLALLAFVLAASLIRKHFSKDA